GGAGLIKTTNTRATRIAVRPRAGARTPGPTIRGLLALPASLRPSLSRAMGRQQAGSFGAADRPSGVRIVGLGDAQVLDGGARHHLEGLVRLDLEVERLQRHRRGLL